MSQCSCYDDAFADGFDEGYAEGKVDALEDYNCPDCDADSQRYKDHATNLLLDLRYAFDIESEELVQKALTGLFALHDIKI